jgi:hypothetical protein
MSYQPVFSDDFEDGVLDPTWKYIADWLTDHFQEANGVLSSNGINLNWSALYVDKQFGGKTRQTVQVRMDSLSTNKSVIILVAQDSNYYYYVIFKWGAQVIEIQRVPKGSGDPGASAESIVANIQWSNPQLDTWQTLQVEYDPSNGQVIVTVDGTEIYNNTVLQLANLTPFSGIGVVKEVLASFDNYSLEATQVGTPITQVDVIPVLSVAGVVEAVAGQPYFTIVSYTDRVTVPPGGSFTVDVTVKNEGDTAGNVTVRLIDHNGALVDQKTITLDPGAQQTVTLSAVAPSEVGTYTWTIEAYNETTGNIDSQANVTVEVSEVARAIIGVPMEPSPYSILIALDVVVKTILAHEKVRIKKK